MTLSAAESPPPCLPTPQQLNVQLDTREGHILLRDLQINADTLNQYLVDKPYQLSEGRIGSVYLSICYEKILSDSFTLTLSNVELVLVRNPEVAAAAASKKDDHAGTGTPCGSFLILEVAAQMESPVIVLVLLLATPHLLPPALTAKVVCLSEQGLRSAARRDGQEAIRRPPPPPQRWMRRLTRSCSGRPGRRTAGSGSSPSGSSRSRPRCEWWSRTSR